MNRECQPAVVRKLGRRVQELRKLRKWTQEKLAERSALDATYLSGIERGIRNPSLGSLLQIAQGLEMGLCDLLAPICGEAGMEDPQVNRIVSLLHGRNAEELQWVETAISDILRWGDALRRQTSPRPDNSSQLPTAEAPSAPPPGGSRPR